VSELVDRARVILSRELNVDVSALLPNQRLREDLGMDSIIALNLIFAAERELEVVIKEEEVVALVTVQDLERLIDRFSDQT
jgi:acyl carrier protein